MNTDKEAHGDARLQDREEQKYVRPDCPFSDITSGIIHAAIAVHNALGCGLLENVYQNALAWELTLDGRQVAVEKEFRVFFREKQVGNYIADLVVDDKVLVETKAVDCLTDVHRAQVLNYLRISGLRVGLLINFSKTRLEWERLVV